MSKKMLINVVHPEEARVAIVEDGRLVELDIEIAGSEQTRGNVYKAVVVRVEPGLQAAFVDIGLKKLGFLQMGELHPDFWQWRDDIPEEQRKRRPRIQEVLRRGQELIVQVEKGERDMKGAALTTYLSLPGRYMVLMPGSDSAGISRKVESEADRKKLKEMVSQLTIPEGVGYIMRTEALGKTKTELNKDLKSLLKLNQEIKQKAAKAKAPASIYLELNLVIRTIRDYFTAEIDEVLVDSTEVYQQAKDFFKKNMPKYENIVKLHQEKRPIFSRYQLEEQIDQIHEKKVPLKSGGSLVIEPTEALVSIDVNSGKSTGEKGVEETAFKTNMEAAEEAARQLRLRDLGGLIVLDFIDMRDKKHMIEVERTLKNALKADKARVTVGRISQFGMLEMSRQRIRPMLSEANYLMCPHCEGRGKVKSVENMAISFLRKVHAAAAKGTTAEVHGSLPLEVAYYLLNRKKRELTQIENDYDIEVTVKGKPSFLMNQLDLELVRREKPVQLQPPLGEAALMAGAAEAAETPTEAVVALGAEDMEGKAKKKRRRKKKARPEGEAEQHVELAELEAEAPSAEIAEAVAVQEGEQPGEELHAEQQKKKRRRRKRRGAKAHVEEAAVDMSPAQLEAGESAEPLPAQVAEPVEEAVSEEHKKKRRRRKRRGKAHPEGLPPQAQHAMEVGTEGEPRPAVAEQISEAAEEGALPEEHKKKRRRRKRGADKVSLAQETAAGGEPSETPPAAGREESAAAEVPQAKAEIPKKLPRARKKATPLSAEPTIEAPLAAPIMETAAGTAGPPIETQHLPIPKAPESEGAPPEQVRAPRKRKPKTEVAAVKETVPLPTAEAEPQPAAPERKKAPRRKKKEPAPAE